MSYKLNLFGYSNLQFEFDTDDRCVILIINKKIYIRKCKNDERI